MALDICPACGYPTIGANMCAACSLAAPADAQWPVVYEEAPAPAA
ncbi:hypothetical protein FHT40_001308 [Mycolicibacterium sp. BK556]|nr:MULTISPECIES: hypothetical protein [Mycobacteriaceae]MBB3601675.1 hypothetical protein [Mycolicibacterium sp. BK556]MBB3631427.1 hypothetical protein [Mycolicibacterium sp. BK607]MBB3749431.1 hypothetical protein [Mycolicibacterium sp. BK634]TDO14350.1 hypothetical protein EV580_2477 [Mycobacterium sp. BK086]